MVTTGKANRVASDDVSESLRSPLHDRHVALGAKLGDFGGWLMPLEYAGGGVLAEHGSVRSAVGLFDVSHLGNATVTGPGARDFVNRCLSNDLGRIAPGKAQYTLCLDESGGVVDDLIAYLVSDERVDLVPNAANTTEVVRRLTAEAAAGVEVVNRHRDLAILAVQGPRSAEVLSEVGLPTALDYMAHTAAVWGGEPATVCRSGYTGERGFEVVVPVAAAGSLWDALLDAVRAREGLPCGLGARDTLRTEMGYPLHGQDLSPSITPVQARLGWAVGWDKPAFWGRDAALAERATGPRRRLWGLRAEDRGIPRPHLPVSAGGSPVGEVTSGTFSPTLRVGIGLALLDAAVSKGEAVQVDVRGRPSTMRVVAPPFVEASVA